jgi:hypothetical protein
VMANREFKLTIREQVSGTGNTPSVALFKFLWRGGSRNPSLTRKFFIPC